MPTSKWSLWGMVQTYGYICRFRELDKVIKEPINSASLVFNYPLAIPDQILRFDVFNESKTTLFIYPVFSCSVALEFSSGQGK